MPWLTTSGRKKAEGLRVQNGFIRVQGLEFRVQNKWMIAFGRKSMLKKDFVLKEDKD
jgi:hypothetical protein